MVSTDADGQHRRSGAQRQQVSHWTILVHRLAPAAAGALEVNVEMELRCRVNQDCFFGGEI
jgi:hypothetical protein